MTTSQQVQAQLPKSNERLWVSDNGDVLCDNHAGTYPHHWTLGLHIHSTDLVDFHAKCALIGHL